jgi:ferredoxin
MTHIIMEPCIGVKDLSCVDVCPVDCIYGADEEDWKMLYIQPEECIDCGLCVDACPVEAILPEEEVPEKWNAFIAMNYEKFDLQPPE